MGRRWRGGVGVVCAALVSGGWLTGSSAEEAPSPAVVHTITIADQIITPTVAEYITNAIGRAEDAKATALLIQLDTPGGLLTATQEIVRAELNAKVPIIVYVAPKGARAASAGVFITMAAHVAAMAPSTRIGAAHPVTIGGEGEGPGWKWPKKEKKDEAGNKKQGEKTDGRRNTDDGIRNTDGGSTAMGAKVMADTIAWVSGIAKERGRNVEWAIQSVKESRSSTAEEAKTLGVIDLIVESPEALLQAIHGRTIDLPSGRVTIATKDATIQPIPMTWRQQLLQVLSNPNIAYILMILGFYGLLFEITHPGSWIPGIAGAICLILAFYALQTLPTNYAGLALILLAVALLIAEIKITSYGFLTLAALVALFLGSLMLVHSPAEFMRVSLKVIIPVVAVTGGVAAFLTTLVVRAQQRRVVSGVESLVGATAEVDTACNPLGKVFVAGELWDAVSDTPANVGEKVRIVAVEGMQLKVTKGGIV